MDSKNFKILIADDSLLARKKLKDCLASLDYTNIIEAKDGTEALEQYKSEKPDLVFMDIVMPKQFGTDAVKDILTENSEAVIIMVSSVGTKKYIQDSLKAGAKDFISKPFTSSQVLSVLERYNH
ncbi:MAG: response regulator [Lachnospiraceae bacterium]|nr:response regulator [Lachnospiraceae bacterium]